MYQVACSKKQVIKLECKEKEVESLNEEQIKPIAQNIYS